MTGVRFKDWETFLRYVGSQEKMKHKEESHRIMGHGRPGTGRVEGHGKDIVTL